MENEGGRVLGKKIESLWRKKRKKGRKEEMVGGKEGEKKEKKVYFGFCVYVCMRYFS